MRRYPDALVLLTLRDGDDWYRSACDTIFKSMERVPDQQPPERRPHLRMIQEIIREGIFADRLRDRDHAIGVYEAHIAAVRAEVPAHRLIEYRVADGWSPLCRALGPTRAERTFPERQQFGGVPRALAQALARRAMTGRSPPLSCAWSVIGELNRIRFSVSAPPLLGFSATRHTALRRGGCRCISD